MTHNQSKKQESSKSGKYTATGFVPSKPQPKKSITLWAIITGKA